MLAGLSKRWTTTLQFAAVLVGAVLTFVVQPPRLTPANEELGFVRMAEFVAAIVILLVVLAARRNRWSASLLTGLSVAALIAGIASFLGYFLLAGSWSCSDYDGRGPIIIGSNMVADQLAYARAEGRSACEMVQDVAGATSKLWPAEELRLRYIVLAGLFLWTVLAFVLAAVLALQTAQAPKRAARGRRTP